MSSDAHLLLDEDNTCAPHNSGDYNRVCNAHNMPIRLALAAFIRHTEHTARAESW